MTLLASQVNFPGRSLSFVTIAHFPAHKKDQNKIQGRKKFPQSNSNIRISNFSQMALFCGRSTIKIRKSKIAQTAAHYHIFFRKPFLSYLYFHMQQSDMLKSTQEERVLGTFVFLRYFFISWMAEFIIYSNNKNRTFINY